MEVLNQQSYRHKMSAYVTLLVSDLSSRHNSTERVCMDSLCVHVVKRKEIFQISINCSTFHDRH
jgi:hypothetical protein